MGESNSSLMILLILGLTLSSLTQTSKAFTTQRYYEALEKSILFFEGQRSGRLPQDQRLTWRGHSGLSDGSSYHVDLVGGYYDAGDNMKFGLPMAFTTTMLAWSVIEFGSSMHDQLLNAQAAIRWGADYLLKAATATPDTLYVQVGDPNRDHSCWERPEDMDTPRGVYQVSTQNPGSDVAAETAAALAAASIVFKDSDPSYSSELMVGFGNKYPLHVHHRGSSLPSVHSHPAHIGCNDGFQYLNSGSPNPNILVGAILGGPDFGDNFSDDRNNYRQSEPATYINAAFVGAAAYFSAE